MEFFKSGGWSMIFVLGFSAATLGLAIASAIKPRTSREPVLRSLTTGTVFAVLCGVAMNLAAVGSKVPQNPEWAHSPDLALIVMTGISESLAPAVLGFSLLAIAWMIASVGARRLARESV